MPDAVAAFRPAQRDWPFAIRKLHPRFGAEILGVTLEQAVSEALFPKIHEAFLDHQVLLFRQGDLPPAMQVAFARRFGEVQIHPMSQYHGYGHKEIYLLHNLDAAGNPNGRHPDLGTLYWHTDGSWRERTGLATMMYAEVCPGAGGKTQFCSMYAAWDALSAEWKARLSGMRAIHNLDFSRTRRQRTEPLTPEQKALVPPVAHPIARVHPETGRRCLFVGDHAESIEGMPYEEGRALIEEINALATPAHLIYSHQWTPGECIVWDNRCTLHRATPYDPRTERRVMRRCTINGDRPSDNLFD
jgi:taurine dioxygenase